MEKTNIRLFALSFAMMFLLVALLAIAGVTFLHSIQNRFDNLANVDMLKVALVQDLNRIARQRQSMLVTIAKTRDVFERDDLITRFNSAANEFVRVRERLLRIGLNEKETNLVEQQREMSRRVVPKQLEFIDLIVSGRENDAEKLFFNSIVEQQEHVIRTLDRLVGLIQVESNQFWLKGAEDYRASSQIMIGLGIFAMVVVVVVAIAIIKRLSTELSEKTKLTSELSEANRLIKENNETLERRVAERTETLNESNDLLVKEIQQRREVENHMALYVQQAPIAIIALTPDLVVVEWNPAAKKLFGFSRDEMVGKRTLSGLFFPGEAEKFHDHWSQSLANISTKKNIVCKTKMDGELISEWVFAPIVDTFGKVVRVYCTVQDVTERTRIANAQNEFIVATNHELRTPLSELRASLELMSSMVSERGGDVELKRLVNVGVVASERLAQLISDIVDYEKLSLDKMKFNFERCNAKELVDAAIRAVNPKADEKHVSFVVHVETRVDLTINVDRKRFVQVMVNLLCNAAKFSPEHSMVDVTLAAQSSRLVISVKDNGPGIPDECRNRIFTRFSGDDSSPTRPRVGSGWGLAISKAIVEKLHGRIGFAVEAGKGTTFSFELPLASTASAERRIA